ncbi:uncharacterized protein [Nicotiana sylvestris]|uniref:uncharacterized protein n=1 Tax=Nicotiana sylvestris TaxID=4096 RepID=UPI00388CCC78
MYQQPSNPPPYPSHCPRFSNNEMRRIENMFKQIMEKNADSNAQLASYNTFLRNLEVQLGQISQALNTHPKGALPSDTVVNPNGGTPRDMSWSLLQGVEKVGMQPPQVKGNLWMMSKWYKKMRFQIMRNKKFKRLTHQCLGLLLHILKSLAKKNGENQFKKFIDMMKSLSINVPLVEALRKMPGYAKLMKDLVTKKRSMNCETIKMTHQVSAIVHSMAPKLEDPNAFTITCTIGSAEFAKALYDLGANFVILDCEVDYEVPIILGRPFLATGKALVDVEAGELTFRVGDEKVGFHVCKSMRPPNSTDVCSFVDLVTDVIVDETSVVMNIDDTLEAVLLNCDDEEIEGYVKCVNSLQGMGLYTSEPHKLYLDL